MKIFAALIILLFPLSAEASQSFENWTHDFRVRAAKSGISMKTLDAALDNIAPIERVIKLDQNQPTKKWTFEEYKARILSKDRIRTGRKLYKKHYKVLKETEAKYGVPAEVIVALWGTESNFGQNMGGFDVIASLATLAWEGRRRDFFTEELLNALQIIDAGHVKRENMKGSWAGAMGQCQFMPTSFNRLAQDGDGDGRKDIWGTEADVFASAANYLSKSGWEAGYKWGREVRVPKNISNKLVNLKIEKPLDYWQKIGVRQINGHDLPQAIDLKASLVAPDGLGGATYLVYNNYKVIMKWNRSTYFATSVGLLANQIAY